MPADKPVISEELNEDKISLPDFEGASAIGLAFRDTGRLIDNHDHPLLLRWAARDKSK
jgi:hypothetical protein